MPDTLLFPRLQPHGVRVIVAALADLADKDWTLRREYAGTAVKIAATGGRRITDDELSSLRKHVLEIASNNGFPVVESTGFRTFDTELAIDLLERDLVPGAEALRDDVWAFIATVLLPDVVRWRFGADTADRYSGGVRNAFQRLWLRAASFSREPEADDRWELVRALSEDANVQILERPRLSSSREVSRQLAEAWLNMSKPPRRLSVEEANRAASITLRITNQVVNLQALPDDELAAVIEEHYRRGAGLT
jgi:hypothetical protein